VDYENTGQIDVPVNYPVILITLYIRKWGCIFFDPLRKVIKGKYSINKYILTSEGISCQSWNEMLL
jgi:hypothetical protein